MAARKTTSAESVEQTFSKEQILASSRFADRRDIVDALLDEDKTYSIDAVDKLIENYMKGQVE